VKGKELTFGLQGRIFAGGLKGREGSQPPQKRIESGKKGQRGAGRKGLLKGVTKESFSAGRMGEAKAASLKK